MIHTLLLQLYIFDAYYLDIPFGILVQQILLNISVISTTQKILLEKNVRKRKVNYFEQSFEKIQYTISIIVQNHAFLWLKTGSGDCSIQKVSCMKNSWSE